MNRRDVLKLFGVGAFVSPMARGTTQIAAGLKLIEIQKIEHVRFTSVLYKVQMTVSFTNPDTARFCRNAYSLIP